MEPSKGRILVVDDHARNVVILQKILGREYRVATAASGEEALQVAPRFAPDVVLLDIMMPGIDGYETCRRFRAMPQLSNTKIIMVSAKAMLSERLAGYEAGADDYIIKPFDENELLVKVRVFMRLKTVEEVDRLKTDILMLLSHETRTPLATILSPLELVLDDMTLSETNRKLLNMAQSGARGLNEFVDRLILLSSLHSGIIRIERTRQDVATLAYDAIAEKQAAATAAGIELVGVVAGGLEAEFDPTYLKGVMVGLLDNAIRLSPRSSTIEIRLTAQDGYACLSVADQGPGVAEHFLPHVFDGLTVHDSSHRGGSHGLSLVTARAIVRRHDGMLMAENGDHAGAIFTMRLPLSETLGTQSAEISLAQASGVS